MHENFNSSYSNYNSKPVKTPPNKTFQLLESDEEMEENKNNAFNLDLKPLVATVSKSRLLSAIVLMIPLLFVLRSEFFTKANQNIPIASKLQDEKLAQQNLDFTRAEYERLKLGMSLAVVEAILDRGIEIEQSAKETTFFWKNPDKSSITVIFENGKLKRKKQEGL